jgi:hypothetical protein
VAKVKQVLTGRGQEPSAAPPKLLSQRQYARLRGVSQVAVSKAVRSGRIPTINGKIDPVAADRAWIENTDQSKPRNSVTGDPKMRRSDPPAPARRSPPANVLDEIEDESSGSVAASYATSRALREKFNAALAQLEYDERSAKVVQADDVRIATFNVARSARNQLLSLPDRLAPILAAIASTREVHNLLTVEVRRVCEELSADADPDSANR